MSADLIPLLGLTEFLNEFDTLALFRFHFATKQLHSTIKNLKDEWRKLCIEDLGSEEVLMNVFLPAMQEMRKCEAEWYEVGRWVACTKAVFGNSLHFSHTEWTSSIRDTFLVDLDARNALHKMKLETYRDNCGDTESTNFSGCYFVVPDSYMKPSHYSESLLTEIMDRKAKGPPAESQNKKSLTMKMPIKMTMTMKDTDKGLREFQKWHNEGHYFCEIALKNYTKLNDRSSRLYTFSENEDADKEESCNEPLITGFVFRKDHMMNLWIDGWCNSFLSASPTSANTSPSGDLSPYLYSFGPSHW